MAEGDFYVFFAK